MTLGGVERFWATAASAAALASAFGCVAANAAACDATHAVTFDDEPQPIYREVVCLPVATAEFPGARVGQQGGGSIIQVSSLAIQARSPYHYSANGQLYVQFHAGAPMATIEVEGNYYELEGLNTATLRANHNPELGVIHLDFLNKKNNGSFIETRDGPIYRMDCSASPESPQRIH